MARITGIELQDNWKVGFALTRIKGIGWSLAKKILINLKIDEKKRTAELTSEEIAKIQSAVEKSPVEGELMRLVKANVTRLKQIGTYRGIRHAKSLPVRGQRTRSNARTKRGKRKTIGAFKKEALTKTQRPQKEEAK